MRKTTYPTYMLVLKYLYEYSLKPCHQNDSLGIRGIGVAIKTEFSAIDRTIPMLEKNNLVTRTRLNKKQSHIEITETGKIYGAYCQALIKMIPHTSFGMNCEKLINERIEDDYTKTKE